MEGLSAKLVVVVLVALVVGIVTIALNVAVANAILSARDIDFSLSGDGVMRALTGQVLVTVLYGLAGFGLGALFRSPVAAITVVVCQPLIVEPIVFGVRNEVGKWLPFNAGSALTTIDPGDEFLQSAVVGGLVLAAYCLALVVAGALLVSSRTPRRRPSTRAGIQRSSSGRQGPGSKVRPQPHHDRGDPMDHLYARLAQLHGSEMRRTADHARARRGLPTRLRPRRSP